MFSQYAVRFELNMSNLQNVQHTASTEKGSKSVTFNLLSLPLYMVEELPRIVNLLGGLVQATGAEKLLRNGLGSNLGRSGPETGI